MGIVIGAVGPADVWTAWSADPLIVGGLLLTAWAYTRGVVGARRTPSRARVGAAVGGWVAVLVAVVSPLDAAAGSLASAHMVQHLLLTVVAAPLLVAARPGTELLRGAPPRVRVAVARVRGRAGLSHARTRAVWLPVVAWLAHVLVLWAWHARALYDLALRHDLVHALEHATFLGTALLVWGAVLGARGARPVEGGGAMLLVFALGLQGVLLGALMTFSTAPWYDGYATTTAAWGLTPLADQQLAGVIMWVPTGLVHLGAVLALLAGWLRDADDPADRRRPAEV